MSVMLDVQDLRKEYTSWRGFLWKNRVCVPALRGVSFQVKKGEIFGLLGPNGTGKTTIVNILAGIVTKDSGSVRVFDEEFHSELRGRMNVASGFTELMSHLSVYQNLRFFAAIYGVTDYKDKIDSLLRRFGVYGLQDKKYYLLSAGEKARVNLCKGLINNPELLLLDEATVGLDPDIAFEVRKEVKELDTTIVLTSHNMAEVEELCDRIAFLKNGKIIHVGTPTELIRLVPEQRIVIDFYPTRKDVSAVLKKLGVKIVECDGLRFVVSAKHVDRKIHEVLEPLFDQGFMIRDLAIEKPALEDVFIALTRGK